MSEEKFANEPINGKWFLTQTQPNKPEKQSFLEHSLKHTDLYSNNVVAQKVEIQNYLGLKLDKKQNFREQLKHKFGIVNKEIGTLKKLSNYLLCHSLVIFIKPLNDLI